jgi:protein TonB
MPKCPLLEDGMDSLSRQQKSLYIFLGVIFTVHALVMVVKLRDQFSQAEWTPQKSIKLKLVQEAIKEMATSQNRQIVQSEDSESTSKKDKSFLSDKTRSFERETVSKNIDSFKRAAMGDSAVTQQARTKESETKAKPNLKDLKLSDVGIQAGDPLPKKVARTPASQSVKGMKNGDPLSQGLSATNDYVEEVRLGDFTHLNTVEYKFYGFYHRIRQKLEQFWGKSIQEKAEQIFRSGRRLPASENLITSLQVTLNESGEIVRVKILGASGVKELDDAAIESFNQAGPFPNPPKDLLVNGKVTIDWGFVVKS